HHGSTRAATLRPFIAATDASLLVRSSGQRDRDTKALLWSAIGERQYYNTAECGAVCIKMTSDAIRVETFHRATGHPPRQAAAPPETNGAPAARQRSARTAAEYKIPSG